MAAADNDLSDAVELIHNRLYWVTLHSMHLPPNTHRSHYFSIDTRFVYEPFFADFGPLNLGCTYRYCKMLDDKMRDPALKHKKIIHCTSSDPKKRANAAYLMGAYMVIVMSVPAENAFAQFQYAKPPLATYVDATASHTHTFRLTVLDCLQGLEFSVRLKLFDWHLFNVDSYEFFEKVENGDLSWVLPGRMLAFAGPYPTSTDEDGFPTWTPEDYVPMFLDAGIRLVIRLNRKTYDKRRFIDHGIKHVDLYFADGTCPSTEIISKFLHICENERGPIAIHCKAGLGRTGTLIGLYAMKHLRFPARAFIGWNRICRPGSILGPQQQFLVDCQHMMFQAGAMSQGPQAAPSLSAAAGINGAKHDDDAALSTQMGRMTVGRDLKEEEKREDVGQGAGLCRVKRAQMMDGARFVDGKP